MLKYVLLNRYDLQSISINFYNVRITSVWSVDVYLVELITSFTTTIKLINFVTVHSYGNETFFIVLVIILRFNNNNRNKFTFIDELRLSFKHRTYIKSRCRRVFSYFLYLHSTHMTT